MANNRRSSLKVTGRYPLTWQAPDLKRRNNVVPNQKRRFFRRSLSFVFVMFKVFVLMVIVGGLMQLIRTKTSNKTIVMHVDRLAVLDSNVFRSNFLATCQATWLSLKLWVGMLAAVLFPLSFLSYHCIVRICGKMEPFILSFWTLSVNLHWTTKIAVVSFLSFTIFIMLLHREIRQRRYIQRLQDWYSFRVAASQAWCEQLLNAVRRKSRILAYILPHVIFIVIVSTVRCVAKDLADQICTGLGGWIIMVALPMLFSTRVLILYEMEFGKMMKELRLKRSQALAKLNRGRKLKTGLVEPKSPFRELSEKVLAVFNKFNDDKGHTESDSEFLNDEELRDIKNSKFGMSKGSMSAQSNEIRNGVLMLLEYDPKGLVRHYNMLNGIMFWLQYWTIVGVALLLEQLPLSRYILALLPFWPFLRVSLSLWLQFPGTTGVSVAFRITAALVSQFFGGIESYSSVFERGNFFINLLLKSGLIGTETCAKISEMASAGGAVLIMALPFFFLPSVITGVGVTVIGIGRPIVSATNTLVAMEYMRATATHVVCDSDAASLQRYRNRVSSLAAGTLQTTEWVEYWIIYTQAMIIHDAMPYAIYWFPFYYHSLLLAILWLQLPYFHGAHRLFYGLQFLVLKTRTYCEDGLVSSASKNSVAANRLNDVPEFKEPRTPIRISRSDRCDTDSLVLSSAKDSVVTDRMYDAAEPKRSRTPISKSKFDKID